MVSAAFLATTLLCGCKAREMGVNFSDQQSTTVDDSWLTAVKTCWPDVGHQGYSVPGLKRYLADPLHIRAAFGSYASLTDSQLRAMIARPVNEAPAPDTVALAHSNTPVFTRDQAVAGTDPKNAAADQTDGSAPPDALCAVQSGTPIGFK